MNVPAPGSKGGNFARSPGRDRALEITLAMRRAAAPTAGVTPPGISDFASAPRPRPAAPRKELCQSSDRKPHHQRKEKSHG